MSKALDNAKAAYNEAKRVADTAEREGDTGRMRSRKQATEYTEALALAQINAHIAQAEALERIAASLNAKVDA